MMVKREGWILTVGSRKQGLLIMRLLAFFEVLLATACILCWMNGLVDFKAGLGVPLMALFCILILWCAEVKESKKGAK